MLQAGSGALSSRVAQVRAGIPHTVPLSTVNRQCSSGLQAVAHVAAGIKAGHYAVGIAAGERQDQKRLLLCCWKTAGCGIVYPQRRDSLSLRLSLSRSLLVVVCF